MGATSFLLFLLIFFLLAYLRNVFLFRKAKEIMQAEKALRESEERFRNTMDNMLEGCQIIGRDWRYVYINDAAERQNHRPKGELIGKRFMDMWPGIESTPLFTVIRSCLEERTAQTLEIRFTFHDGTVGWFDLSIEPVPEGVFIISMDVTERKQAEKILELRLKLMQYAVSQNLEEVLQAALDEIGSLSGSPIGFYHFVDADEKTLSLQAWSAKTMQEFCRAEGKGLHYGVDRAGVWVDSIRERRPVIHNDYPSLPHRKGMPPGHAAVQRELTVPIFRNRKIVAILGLGNKPTDYTEDDIRIVSFLADVTWEMAQKKRAEEALEEERRRLQQALDEVRTLRGIVPICASCKNIRDDKGFWNQVEKYVSDHTEAEFSHSICPDCAEKLYPELYKKGDEKP